MKTCLLKLNLSAAASRFVIIIVMVISFSNLFNQSNAFAQDSSKTKSEHKHKMEMKDDHKHIQDNKAMMDSCKQSDKMEMKEKCKKVMSNMKDGEIPESCKQMMKEHKDMMNHDKMMKKDSSSSMKMEMKGMDMGHNMKMDMNKDKKKSPLIREGQIDLNAIDENKDGKVFQDTMDWNVISDKPGECPLCGMKLKEVTLEKAKENLQKNNYKVK